MTDSRRPFDATQPEPIDDNEDRMGSMEELDFDEEEPSARIGDLMPEDELAHEIPEKRVREAGMTGAFIGGPLCAIVAFVVGLTRRPRATA